MYGVGLGVQSFWSRAPEKAVTVCLRLAPAVRLTFFMAKHLADPVRNDSLHPATLALTVLWCQSPHGPLIRMGPLSRGHASTH